MTTLTTDTSRPGPATTRTLEFAVTGMTCAACAARVQKQLGRLDGVTAQVNYATEKPPSKSPTPGRLRT